MFRVETASIYEATSRYRSFCYSIKLPNMTLYINNLFYFYSNSNVSSWNNIYDETHFALNSLSYYVALLVIRISYSTYYRPISILAV